MKTELISSNKLEDEQVSRPLRRSLWLKMGLPGNEKYILVKIFANKVKID